MTNRLKGPGDPIARSTSQLRRAAEPKVQKKSQTQAQSVDTAPELQADFTDRVDPRSLPKSFGGQQSPLGGLIHSGFDILARLYGLDGAQGALQLQLAALGGSEAPEAAFSAESRKSSTRQFVSLGFEREEATRLVDLLAFVVAGLFTAPGTKKSHRELQIQHEIDGFRRAVTEMRKSPLGERDSMLAKVGEQLLGKADQIGQRLKDSGAKELPRELELVENRIRAVFDIVEIVSRNVLATPAA